MTRGSYEASAPAAAVADHHDAAAAADCSLLAAVAAVGRTEGDVEADPACIRTTCILLPAITILISNLIKKNVQAV